MKIIFLIFLLIVIFLIYYTRENYILNYNSKFRYNKIPLNQHDDIALNRYKNETVSVENTIPRESVYIPYLDNYRIYKGNTTTAYYSI